MNACLIMCLVILDHRRLCLCIQMRRDALNHLQSAHSVGDRHDRISVDALAPRPLAPLAVDRARRVDQNSV